MFLLNKLFNNIRFGVIQVNVNGELIYVNKVAEELFNMSADCLKQKKILNIIPNSNIIAKIKSKQPKISLNKSVDHLLMIEISYGDIDFGSILIANQKDYFHLEQFYKDLKKSKHDLESLMELSGELVTITDGEGRVLRVSAQCEKMMGVKENEFVGKTVYELEREGILNFSSTAIVLKTKKMCKVTQVTKPGKRLFVRGYPIFNSRGKLVKVINISKDITEEYKLKQSLQETENLLKIYQRELRKIESRHQDLVMKSEKMKEIFDLIHRIADLDVTVLLLGESGVGKGMIARLIHDISLRKNKPFITINCGAIPETLIESELFGYVKGAFTGGHEKGKQGLFMAANGGTLFLDEIGELPLNLQVKLLQAIQEKRITPIGQTEPIDIDVRIITATNRNLAQMVKEGKFRKDLYYRLNVIPVNIPPLRERKQDIPLLVEYFLDKYNKKYNQMKYIDKEVIQLFMDYKWEGNVRELENTIERLVVTVTDDTITIDHLPHRLHQDLIYSSEGSTLKQLMEAYEKKILIETLKSSKTMNEMSKKLGVDVSTISRKIKKYRINVAEMQTQL